MWGYMKVQARRDGKIEVTVPSLRVKVHFPGDDITVMVLSAEEARELAIELLLACAAARDQKAAEE